MEEELPGSPTKQILKKENKGWGWFKFLNLKMIPNKSFQEKTLQTIKML
jgi:hypothetical protein